MSDAELRALAEKAPKGEWFDNSYHGIFAVDKEVGDAEDNYVVQVAAVMDFDYQEHGGDALFGKKAIATRDFIAACSPDRILALLDGKAAAERELKVARTELEHSRRSMEHPNKAVRQKNYLAKEVSALRTSLTRAEAVVEAVGPVIEAWNAPAEPMDLVATDIHDDGTATYRYEMRNREPMENLRAALAAYDETRAALPAQPKEGERMNCQHKHLKETGYDDMRACLDCGATVIIETPERIAAAEDWRTRQPYIDGGNGNV